MQLWPLQRAGRAPGLWEPARTPPGPGRLCKAARTPVHAARPARSPVHPNRCTPTALQPCAPRPPTAAQAPADPPACTLECFFSLGDPRVKGQRRGGGAGATGWEPAQSRDPRSRADGPTYSAAPTHPQASAGALRGAALPLEPPPQRQPLAPAGQLRGNAEMQKCKNAEMQKCRIPSPAASFFPRPHQPGSAGSALLPTQGHSG